MNPVRKKIVKRVPFEEKTVKYKKLNEDNKWLRGTTNENTWKLWKDRYVVIRNLIPQDIIDYTMDVWRATEHRGDVLEVEEYEITTGGPDGKPVSLKKSKAGYCTPWGIALHQYVTTALQRHLDIDLRQTYSYTRSYDRGAYLGSHLDRASCEISATLCLDYKTDDNTPWPIWLRNDENFITMDSQYVKDITQNLNHRDREKNNCKKVLLEPGDIMMYQGPNIPHWRDYLAGDYSYHIFLHWYNANTHMAGFNEWFDDEGVKTSAAKQRYSALDFDGRPNRLISSDKRSKQYEAFQAEYDRDKQAQIDFVNNYDELVLDVKENKDDSI